MPRGAVQEGAAPASVLRRLQPLANQHAVSVDHLAEVVRARRVFRRAYFYRKRARKRALKRNPEARKFRFRSPVVLSGEGRFHELLRLAGLNERSFAEFAGITVSSVRRWYGFPLHGWPIALLEMYVHNQTMARFLVNRGWDPERFKASPLPRATQGQYPRTGIQGQQLLQALQPDFVDCPIHGHRKALGGECPDC